MGEWRGAYRVLVRKTEAKRSLGRHLDVADRIILK
jgi:hypothetical protein